jgi:hypothetical protein
MSRDAYAASRSRRSLRARRRRDLLLSMDKPRRSAISLCRNPETSCKMNTDRFLSGRVPTAWSIIRHSLAEATVVFCRFSFAASNDASTSRMAPIEVALRPLLRKCINAQLTATRYSQLLKLDSCRKVGNLRKSRINTSWVRSSASAKFLVICKHHARTDGRWRR